MAKDMGDKKKEGPRAGVPAPKPGTEYVNMGTEAQMEIYGYQKSRLKTAVTWAFIFVTVGLLRLVFHWKPDWMLRCTHRRCDLAQAEKVMLQDVYKQWFVGTIKTITKDGTRVTVHKDKSRARYAKSFKKMDGAATVALANLADESLVRYFINKKIKYIWNPSERCFTKLSGLEEGTTCSMFHHAEGLTSEEQARQRVLYDWNVIEVHVTPIIKLLFTQVLNPFYVFQIFSCILWYNDQYYYYASAIILISLVSLSTTVYQTRQMERALKNTVSATGVVNVCQRNQGYAEMPSDLLVPGDVIEVPRHGCIMQCDAVLVSGKCIVSESMLTGESVPVTKTPITNPQMSGAGSDVTFDLRDHSRHVLFCGTNVLQTRYYGKEKVRAVVIRTGFSTTKGELVRSIMFPKPMDFKFSQDTYKFIGVLGMIAGCGMIFTLVIMVMRGSTVRLIILRVLDLVTILIPPALPAAMTFGVMFAQRRLQSQQIYCISPNNINVSGTINVVCFDKTGTLTEDGLDLWGVVPIADDKFDTPEHEVCLLDQGPLVAAMASCHSLTILDGEITGDPLDHKMFMATNWELEEPGEDTTKYDAFMPTIVHPKTPDIVRTSTNLDQQESIPFEIGIVRQFTFSSSLQRMSVIARTLGSDHFDLYAKGSPEKIVSLSNPETVPKNFHEVLAKYTQQGYRVIALAWRQLPSFSIVKVQRVQREQVECDLTFLGLLIMENRLKPETTPIIHQLADAKIRTVMVTGDNLLTAISVARDCDMIDSNDKVIILHALPPSEQQGPQLEWTYAEDTKTRVQEISTDAQGITTVQVDGDSERIHIGMSGKSWQVVQEHFPDVIPKLVVRGTVFARMSPEQKAQLVETLQEYGYYVGMCGDGANDCGALKMAHAGISLSEAEASVASPFTAKEPHIGCVPSVIREGRAALVTSFGIFKFMACYSLTQFTSVTLLYWIGANLTDFEFLWIDLFVLTTLSISFGYTRAYPSLVPEAPPMSLISLTPILSILTQLVIIVTTQVLTWEYVKQQPWFEAFAINEDEDYMSDENTALFCVSTFQYITLAVIFSKSAPYRRTIFSNRLFLGNLLAATLLSVYLVMYPFQWLEELFELKLPPILEFRALYIGIAAINFFVSYIVETFVVDSALIQKKCQGAYDSRYRKANYQYVTVEHELQTSSEWPPRPSATSDLTKLMRLESSSPDTSPEHKSETFDSETSPLTSPSGQGHSTLTSGQGHFSTSEGHSLQKSGFSFSGKHSGHHSCQVRDLTTDGATSAIQKSPAIAQNHIV